MYLPLTYPIIPAAAGVLDARLAAVRAELGTGRLMRRLQDLRPRRRSYLVENARELLASLVPLSVYRDVFGELPRLSPGGILWQPGVAFSATEALVQRIDRECFPLDFEELNDWFSGGDGEDYLPWWIPHTSYGVPWEICGVTEINEWFRPLVVICALSGADPWGGVTGPADIDHFSDWWEMLPAGVPSRPGPEFAWPADERGVAMMHDQLAALEPPLNGLATMLYCTLKTTGNPFLDVPGTWSAEYDHENEFCWCADCVDRLTQFWRAAREGIEAMHVYINWFQRGASSNLIEVIRVLVRLGAMVDRQLEATRRPRTLLEVIVGEEE